MSEITSDSLNRDLIRQLNAENDNLIEQFKALREICYQRDLLITELADWLEDQIEHMGPEFKKAEQLIQRAREATKGANGNTCK